MPRRPKSLLLSQEQKRAAIERAQRVRLRAKVLVAEQYSGPDSAETELVSYLRQKYGARPDPWSLG